MRLVILYGSQTGTAQDIAEQIWRESRHYGFTGPVLPMDEYPIQQLVEERLVVFVAATTGDGDEPDNMKQSWKFLLRRSLPKNSLQQLQFACLGLGDSSYAKFNFAAKKLHKRLLQLGAQSLVPLGLCDDQHDHGYGAVSLPWIKQLWMELQSTSGFAFEPAESVRQVFKWKVEVLDKAKELVSEQALMWPLAEPFSTFTLKSNERTTAADHFQDVRLLKFEVPNEVHWHPGDVFNVRPCNSAEQIEAFFALVKEHALPFNADTVVELSTVFSDMALPLAYAKPVTVGMLAKHIWDFSARPRQRAFQILALNCEDELEREKLLEFTTTEGLDDLIQYIHRPRRTILEVLQDFRYATAKLQLPLLFELFTIIQPRSFSIASVPGVGAGAHSESSLDLLVAVVEYKTKLSTPRLGLCSNWLKNLQPGAKVLGTIKPGTMTLSKDPTTPMIMVGPGTGIAPFRSIIQRRCQQRDADEDIGELVAFFGCRNKAKDFHFASDFRVWQSANLVKGYFAFSRDQEEKIYVQHLIRKNKELLQQLIKANGAVVLVAGSSKNMPKDVREAFAHVLDDDDGVYVEQMIKTKRYQEETWA